MFNNTLRSFALGMIFATTILTAVYLLQPKSLENNTAITESQVEQYLDEKGYVSIPKEEYNELLAQKSNDTDIKQNETKQDAIDIKENDKEGQVTYTLIIESGMNPDEISNILQKSGIIEDSGAFVQFLENKDWSRFIQIGSYELNSSMTYEEIGKIITKKSTSP